MLSVVHPDITNLFIIINSINDALTESLASFLHGERDPDVCPEKELVWSIRNRYSPRHWEDDLEKMEVDVQVFVCRDSKVISFERDDIGENSNEAMVIISDFKFVMERKDNRWVNRIKIPNIQKEYSTIQVSGFLAEKLRQQEE